MIMSWVGFTAFLWIGTTTPFLGNLQRIITVGKYRYRDRGPLGIFREMILPTHPPPAQSFILLFLTNGLAHHLL